MYPNSDKENYGFFYSSDNGKTFHKLSTEPVHLTIHLSDEEAAKIWAQFEGLEIVPNPKRN